MDKSTTMRFKDSGLPGVVSGRIRNLQENAGGWSLNSLLGVARLYGRVPRRAN